MYPESLTEIVDAAQASPQVAAVLLAGSWSTGVPTEHSDIDVWVVSYGPAARLPELFRQPPTGLDIACVDLGEFRDLGAVDSSTEYQR
ncbi:MAG: nucleotidyltransferase domain-containing protein [Chloroflexota bacterium]|nr:nucleotidyltransferase domain-containing protein [Chloroflexota bacterium]